MQQLAATIAALPAKRAVVAVDGVDGAGKTRFADMLAPFIEAQDRHVVRAGMDGFHNPSALRYRRGKFSPDGFFEDSYNYTVMRHDLLEPFQSGADSVATARFDHRSDHEVTDAIAQVPQRSVLLIDGIFLHRDKLAGLWDLSLFLDVDFAVTFARMATRDGCPADPEHPLNSRYYRGQLIYLGRCEPHRRATIVIDNNDPAAPFVTRGPSEPDHG